MLNLPLVGLFVQILKTPERYLYPLIISNGNPATFVTRPISAIILALAVLSLAGPYIISAVRGKPAGPVVEDV